MATVQLAATVDPPLPLVVWYVDGAPFQLARRPYTARLPLTPGHHTIELRNPFRSVQIATVRIQVER